MTNKTNERPLSGKVAVVTGAARGIGRAAAIALAKEGATIVGIDICKPICESFGVAASTPKDLEETGEGVQAAKSSWLGITLDQRDLPSLKKAAAQIEKAFGGIDILFANAGVQGFKPLLEMEDIDWHTHIDVNLTGSANTLRTFAPYIIKSKHGRIILTSSTQGQHGTKFGAAYSASKWGIIGLMKSAALELGKYGVTVNAVIPGLINTPLTRHEERYAQVLQEVGQDPKGMPMDESTAVKILKAKTPLNVPWIEPEDIAKTVVFLASDGARMITGATIDVTGGDSAHNTA